MLIVILPLPVKSAPQYGEPTRQRGLPLFSDPRRLHLRSTLWILCILFDGIPTLNSGSESAHNCHNPKAVVVADARRIPVAIRRAQVCGIVVPRPAAKHPVHLLTTVQPRTSISWGTVVILMSLFQLAAGWQNRPT
jgi:hypothetical protein